MSNFPQSSIDKRTFFIQWLSEHPTKKYTSSAIIDALDEASHYCVSRKFCTNEFWNMKTKAEFNAATSQLLSFRIFRLMYRSVATRLDKAIPLYKEFLDSYEALDTNDLNQPKEELASVQVQVSSSDALQVKTEKEKLSDKLYSILRIYGDSSGLSLSKIMWLLGSNIDSDLVQNILDYAIWSHKIADGIYSFVSVESSSVMNAKPSEKISVISDFVFYDYLDKTLGMAEPTCRSYTSAIRSAEKYASEHHFEYCHLYGCPAEETLMTVKALFEDSEFLEYNLHQHNRFRAAINKLLECVGCEGVKPSMPVKVLVDNNSARRLENDPVRSRYKELLDKYFQKGFRMDSSLDMKKLRRFYLEQYETELADEDGTVCQDIETVAILHDGKAYLPDSMLSREKKDKLLQYIDDRFSSECDAIYYGALFSEFEEILQGERIYTPEMLKTYLSYINNGRYVLQRSYLAKDYSVQMNPDEEIREYLKESVGPVEVEQLASALSYIPEQKIKFALSTNSDFIWNATGEYFHEDCVHFSNSELEWISQFIEDGIEERDFVTGNELVEAVEAHFPDIKEMYQWITLVGMRNVIGYKLKDRFSFNGNIISKYGEELSMAEVYVKYCHKHSRFTLDELNVLKQELGSTIYFDEIYANSLRISQRDFVSPDMAQFDVEATDESIARICTGQYVSLQEIRDFGTFPYAGYPWNEYLVEAFVANYSRKFRLLHIGYNANVCAGAIVKQASSFQNFNDLLIDILANSDIVLNEDSALEYLRQQGYIARRRYSDIGRILTEAKVVRSKKG